MIVDDTELTELTEAPNSSQEGEIDEANCDKGGGGSLDCSERLDPDIAAHFAEQRREMRLQSLTPNLELSESYSRATRYDPLMLELDNIKVDGNKGDSNMYGTALKTSSGKAASSVTKDRALMAVFGMSPAFICDVLRMNKLQRLVDNHYKIISVSEYASNVNHICTNFSCGRGWTCILKHFFKVIIMDYSWLQRDYFYTNYGGERWFHDRSITKGFIQRFFEWDGEVVIWPLDERGDVWKEFQKYQPKNSFSFQLIRHDLHPLVHATKSAENSKAWKKNVPNEFQCKTGEWASLFFFFFFFFFFSLS